MGFPVIAAMADAWFYRYEAFVKYPASLPKEAFTAEFRSAGAEGSAKLLGGLPQIWTLNAFRTTALRRRQTDQRGHGVG